MPNRCRWCGDWLLPVHYGGNGDPYCCEAHHAASLNYQLDIPSPYPATHPPVDNHDRPGVPA